MNYPRSKKRLCAFQQLSTAEEEEPVSINEYTAVKEYTSFNGYIPDKDYTGKNCS
jgi:hypothetical protein